MKVKIFTDILISEVENTVNKWFRNYSINEFNVKDIKFSANSEGFILLIFYEQILKDLYY